jgi:hypothetical protein
MLTAPQLLLVKAAIEADNELNAQPQTPDGAYAIADALNLTASPAFIVWRTSVTQDEIMQNGFDWTRVDNLTPGPARIWEWMFSNSERAFNPSKLNVRAGIDAVWKGTAADLAVRAAVYVHCKRSATRAEKILATGTGSDATPATMGYEGRVTYQDILQARAS